MKIETVINLISNAVIFCSVITYILLMYGKTTSGIWANKYNAILGKLGLAVTACGALLNIVTLSTPNITEVILNCGLSLTFVWIAIHQYSSTTLKRVKSIVSIKEVQQPVKVVATPKPRTRTTKKKKKTL